jgi:hypothetical protein
MCFCFGDWKRDSGLSLSPKDGVEQAKSSSKASMTTERKGACVEGLSQVQVGGMEQPWNTTLSGPGKVENRKGS